MKPFQQRLYSELNVFSNLIVNRAPESQFSSNEILFSIAETGEDHKQVESCETRSEQPETVLKASTADHQGRLTPGSASLL